MSVYDLFTLERSGIEVASFDTRNCRPEFLAAFRLGLTSGLEARKIRGPIRAAGPGWFFRSRQIGPRAAVTILRHPTRKETFGDSLPLSFVLALPGVESDLRFAEIFAPKVAAAAGLPYPRETRSLVRKRLAGLDPAPLALVIPFDETPSSLGSKGLADRLALAAAAAVIGWARSPAWRSR